jgi:hypothetical protein
MWQGLMRRTAWYLPRGLCVGSTPSSAQTRIRFLLFMRSP